MKKFLFIFILLFNFLVAKAEYSGWFIKFTIETKDGKKIVGHKFFNHLDIDSINNTAYFISILSSYGEKDSTVVNFYRHKIKYEYIRGGSGTDKEAIYSLINETSVKKGRIRKITINEVIDSSYLSGIMNRLTLADTTWMKTKPVRFESATGYLCDYQLYFHEYNPEIAKLVKDLKRKAVEASAGSDDDVLPPFMKKFLKYKVIVIETCTC